MRKVNIILVVVAVLGGLLAYGYFNRAYIIVKVIGLASRLSVSVEANQPITWQTGSVEMGENRPPNIIVILTDDMGFNDVSMYGGGMIETPHIDRLAQEGVRFTNGYAGSSVCSPSRAMLLTGRYATRFGFEFTPAPDQFSTIIEALSATDPMPRKMQFTEVHEAHQGHELPFGARGLPTEEVTLAEYLREAGYHTVHIGKWHLGRNKDILPTGQGFDESLLMESGLYLPIDSPDVVNARNDFAVIDRVQWEIFNYAASYNNGTPFEPDGYLTDYYTQEAVKAIAANKDRPFFMYLSHWGIHTPLQALKSDYDALADVIPDHTARVYAAMTRAVDRSVGGVLQALEEHGIDDDTLIIFTSDNGGANYIGLPHINKPYRGWKLTFFEGGTHIPFAMRWRGTLPEGVDFAHPISHLDIMPTALAAAGIAPDTRARKIDGVNLLPFITGQRSGRPHDTLIWREGHYQAIISKGWKLQRADNPAITRLYHLQQDPFETTDLAMHHPDKVAALTALLDAHNAEQADPLWPSRVEIPIWIDKSLADNPTLEDDYIYWPN